MPGGVVTFAGTDFFQLLLVFFQRIVLADGSPGEFADGGNSSHVDAVFFATLEFGKRMFFVAQVYEPSGAPGQYGDGTWRTSARCRSG